MAVTKILRLRTFSHLFCTSNGTSDGGINLQRRQYLHYYLKKKKVWFLHTPSTINSPYSDQIFRKVWGCLFFPIFFNSHQVLDINKFISSWSLPLSFIWTKFTSMRRHRDVGILDTIVCRCCLLGRSHYDCCWDFLLLLFIYDNLRNIFQYNWWTR